MMSKQTTNILELAAVAAGACVVRSLLRRSLAYDVKNKTVLITGGSRGLGLVLAREFAREGARVAICARDEDELERARVDLDSRGADVTIVKCDVRNRVAVEAMVAALTDQVGQIGRAHV